MKWSINLTDKSIITLIQASVQLQSSKKAELVLENTSTGKQVVTEYGKKIYGNRLLADLIDNKFTLKITNAQYNDSGSYSINVISRTPLVEADDAVTVLVYGRVFCYFKGLSFWGISERQSLR